MDGLQVSENVFVRRYLYTGPIQSYSFDDRLCVGLSVLSDAVFLGLSLDLRSHDKFPGLSLVHGRSASTIELKCLGRRASNIERPRVKLLSQMIADT